MGKGVKSAGKLGKPRESSISGVSKSGRDAQKRTISKQLKPQKSLTGCTASNKAFVDQLFASKKPSKRSIAGSEGGDSHGEGTGAGRVQPGKVSFLTTRAFHPTTCGNLSKHVGCFLYHIFHRNISNRQILE
jgi:hypothetical protein